MAGRRPGFDSASIPLSLLRDTKLARHIPTTTSAATHYPYAGHTRALAMVGHAVLVLVMSDKSAAYYFTRGTGVPP